MPLDRHIDDDLLERYSMRHVSDEESASVEEHLLHCEPCRDRLTEMESYVHAMRAAAVQVRQEPRRHGWLSDLFRGGRLVLAIGFAAVLMLLVGLQWQNPRLGSGQPVEIALIAMRGGAQAPDAPPSRQLRLTMDTSGLPSDCCRVEVVDRRGERVFHSSVALQGEKTSVVIPPRDTGTYFVRLYAQSGNLLREFSLPVGRR